MQEEHRASLAPPAPASQRLEERRVWEAKPSRMEEVEEDLLP